LINIFGFEIGKDLEREVLDILLDNEIGAKNEIRSFYLSLSLFSSIELNLSR